MDPVRKLDENFQRQTLEANGFPCELTRLVVEYASPDRAKVWRISYRDLPSFRDDEDDIEDGVLLAETNQAIKKLNLKPYRGDFIVISDSLDLIVFRYFFDGLTVVDLWGLYDNSIIPKQFQAITEFPIGYWNLDKENFYLFHFDQTKFADQLLLNIEYKLLEEDVLAGESKLKSVVVSTFKYKGEKYEIIYIYNQFLMGDHYLEGEKLATELSNFKRYLTEVNDLTYVDSASRYISKPRRLYMYPMV